jgi:phage gp46-like protein
MPFTKEGSDIEMVRNSITGRLDFDWEDETGNPNYGDTNTHRVFSLLLEHRPSDEGPGYWADETGKRGSLLYTVKNVKRSTPSQIEAYVQDALSKAVAEGWISDTTAKAYLSKVTGAQVQVTWKNPGTRTTASVAIGLGS